MTTLFILQAPLFDGIFFLIQGLTINMGLLLMYYKVYLNFKSYHQNILEKYKCVFQERDIQEINRSTREVRNFFIYIGQMLIVQMIYQGSLVMQKHLGKTLWILTFADVINTLLMISYILMYIGISLSIQKAFKAEQKRMIRDSSVLIK